MIEKFKRKKFLILFGIVIVVICSFLARENYNALILALIGIYAIATTGLDLLFGYTGQISFGHAAFFAIGSYGSTLLSMNLGIPTLIAILLASLLSLAIGTLVAFSASKLVKHFLSLLTIAFGQIIYLVVNSWSDLTSGAGGISGIPDINLFGFALDTNQKNLVFIWVFVVVLLIVKKNILNSRVGRSFIAIRENTHAAQGLGINVRRYKVTAFAISAAITGFAGALYAHLVGFISPETYNATQSTLFMTMLLFGGIATQAGPVIGAAVLLLIKELLQNFAQYQVLVFAIFILAALFFFPNGVVGIIQSVGRIVGKGKKKRWGEHA